MEECTLDRLKENLSYDPETGNFTWLIGGGRNTSGTVAGWVSDRYVCIGVLKRTVRAHRLVWFWHHGKWPEHGIDHINGNRLDNRIENLRDVPQKTNNQNWLRARKDSLCGLAGIRKSKYSSWTAAIFADGKRRHLGSFKTQEEAHDAYMKAKRELHEGCTI